MKIKTMIITAAATVMTACSNGNKADNSDNTADTVTVEALKRGTFDEPFMAKGKVKASKYADVAFEQALPVKAVYVHNGQTVAKGQRIAELEVFKLQNAIDQAKKNVEQARLNMQDVIISQGYDPDHINSVPANIRQLAEVKSGYSLAISQLEAARHEISVGTATAPFAGVIANLNIQHQTIAQPGVAICRVISTDEMEVEFKVMEADLAIIKTGTEVNVTPTATKANSYIAKVIDINPLVEENGSVSVRAKLKADKNLFDGMNVEVSFNRHLDNVTIVPKAAIMIRNGHHVVFSFNNGIAKQHNVSIRNEAKGLCVVETDDNLDNKTLIITSGHETVTDGGRVVKKN